MTQADTLTHIGAEAREFIPTFQTLTLATLNADNSPEASYATFVQIGHKLYIYVSELAAHCANLKHSPRCSAMFIENEDQAKTVFARRRLTLQCTVQEIERDTPLFASAMDAFREKFGKFVEMIAPLTDFHLYELSPQMGSYVSGFAKAYHLQGESLEQVAHRNDQGHQTQDPKLAKSMQVLAS